MDVSLNYYTPQMWKKKEVVFPEKVQPRIWCLICQFNLVMTAAGSQISNLTVKHIHIH